MDTNEYERLAALYMDSIYRVALNGCRNHADAEDVVQNTFLKLWNRKEGFESDEHARKWLIRVAVNDCNSLWRSSWKRRTTYLDELSQEPVFSTPEKSYVYYAIMELPTKYRQTIYLYYFEDYCVKEVAQIMGLSRSYISRIEKKALEKLRRVLGE